MRGAPCVFLVALFFIAAKWGPSQCPAVAAWMRLFPAMFCSKQQKARTSALPVPTLTLVWEESGILVFEWWGKVCHGVASFKLAGASEMPTGGSTV